MVELYRLQRDTDIQQIEVAGSDEDRKPVLFKTWLQIYAWEVPEYAQRG